MVARRTREQPAMSVVGFLSNSSSDTFAAVVTALRKGLSEMGFARELLTRRERKVLALVVTEKLLRRAIAQEHRRLTTMCCRAIGPESSFPH